MVLVNARRGEYSMCSLYQQSQEKLQKKLDALPKARTRGMINDELEKVKAELEAAISKQPA